MKRLIDRHLRDWKNSPHRKPLLLRGARQVGKTYAIRQLGKQFDRLVEINFELISEASLIFKRDLQPTRIIRDLSSLLDKPIVPGKTLLFFDEIQAVPEAILSLRYFYELMPELHIIAAGSLIDFALEQVGMPVGRVDSLHMYPLSFLEFLAATGHPLLMQEILQHDPKREMNAAIHNKLLGLVGEYMLVGGMPEAVGAWAEKKDPLYVAKVHQSLISTYQQDFYKYAKKYQIKYLGLLLKEIPLFLGKPFKFASLSGGYKKRELAPCLDLLTTAGVAHRIFHASAQGHPLGAQVNLEKFKVSFLDVALAQTVLGQSPAAWLLSPDQTLVNRGAITESFVGQELLAYGNPEPKVDLYYWHRDARGSSAEVDYVVQINGDIIPVEVKSGFGSTLRSMHAFLESHAHSPYGIRFSTHHYAVQDEIHSYPLYGIAAAVFNVSKFAEDLA